MNVKTLITCLVLIISLGSSKAMYFKPPAFAATWDVWSYYHEGTYYMYYLITEESPGERIGLATSTDAIHWVDRGEIIAQSSLNNSYVGSGGVWKSPNFANDGLFIMNYSEHRSEQGSTTQNIYFAYSTDLINWTKYPPETVFKVDQNHYSKYGRWDQINAFPRPQGGYYGAWTANSGANPGSFGLGYTEDGLKWTALPSPEVTPSIGECAGVYPINGKYYAILNNHRNLYNHVANSVTGPYVRSTKNPQFLKNGHGGFPHFMKVGNEVLVYYQVVSGAFLNNGRDISYFSPFKKVEVDREGIARWKYWNGNEAAKGAPMATSTPSGAGIQYFTPKVNLNVGAVMEGTINLPNTGYTEIFIESDNKYSSVRLFKNGVVKAGSVRADGTGWSEALSFNRDINFGSTAQLRIMYRSGMMEVYLDDYHMTNFTTYAYGRKTTRFGIKSGTQITNPKVWEMSLPVSAAAFGQPYDATATASSVNGNYLANNATDEIPNTRWTSRGTNNEWIYLDLGDVVPIDKINLIWEAAYAKNYNLQISNNATSWTTIEVVTNGNGGKDELDVDVSARYVRLQLIEPGSPYTYSLWEFQAIPPPASDIVDDRDSPTQYAGYWTNHSKDTYHDNTCKVARANQASVSLTFTGSSIAWHGLKNKDLGIAQVFIDNVLVDEIDCYSTQSTPKRLFEQGNLSSGSHTIKIVRKGKKNPASSNYYLVHDYFHINPVLETVSDIFIDDRDSPTQYSGNSTNHSGDFYYNNTCKVLRANQGAVSLDFTGSYIAWHGLKNKDLGIAQIFLDGVLVDEIDCYSASRKATKLYEKSNLSNGAHTIRIVRKEKKNSASSNYYLVHDFFHVKSSSSATSRSNSSNFLVSPIAGRKVFVEWIIDQKFMPTEYVLEYASKGDVFKPIETITAVESVGLEYYRFTHQFPKEGDNNYRVRIIYPEGAEGELPFQTVTFQYHHSAIAAFPNPAQEWTHLDLSEFMGEQVEYVFSNLNGQVLLQGIFDKQHAPTESLYLDSIQNGSYILTFKFKNRSVISKSIQVLKNY